MLPWLLAHEVLHAHQYLVEGVPMLYFAKPFMQWGPGTPALFE
jgi:hypothetical protein